MTYKCMDGMKEENTFSDGIVTATCQDNNVFSLDPTEWPQCLPSIPTTYSHI